MLIYESIVTEPGVYFSAVRLSSPLLAVALIRLVDEGNSKVFHVSWMKSMPAGEKLRFLRRKRVFHPGIALEED